MAVVPVVPVKVGLLRFLMILLDGVLRTSKGEQVTHEPAIRKDLLARAVRVPILEGLLRGEISDQVAEIPADHQCGTGAGSATMPPVGLDERNILDEALV